MAPPAGKYATSKRGDVNPVPARGYVPESEQRSPFVLSIAKRTSPIHPEQAKPPFILSK